MDTKDTHTVHQNAVKADIKK